MNSRFMIRWPIRDICAHGVRVSGHHQFAFTCPDDHLVEQVPKNDSAESFRDIDIETLNREHHLDIDAETCVSLWDGTRMDHAMAVEALLHCDGALQLDPETRNYPVHFPPPRE